MAIIETHKLTKSYGALTAVNAVTLKVPEGKIYGFLGLNGAGKTTTMRMLLGMIKPSSGSARLFGQTITPGTTLWKNVGYMVESTYAYPNLTVKENLALYHLYYGLNDKAAISDIISRLTLDRYTNVRAKHLSLGNLQRLGLAKALMHKPALLILDEPVNGLDPSGIVEVRQLLKSLSQERTTILVSSHLLSEIAKIADTIGIIHQGSLIREIESNRLEHEIEQKLILDTSDNRIARELLQTHGIACKPDSEGALLIREADKIADPSSIADLIVGNQLGLKKLYVQKEDLESYFIRTIHSHQV